MGRFFKGGSLPGVMLFPGRWSVFLNVHLVGPRLWGYRCHNQDSPPHCVRTIFFLWIEISWWRTIP